MITIKHQLFYKGKDGPVKLEETEVRWNLSEQDLSTPRAQVSIMNWESEKFIGERIFVKRQVITTK